MPTDPYADLSDEQLGAKIKAKAKGAYDDIPDADVGVKMRAKAMSVGSLDRPPAESTAARQAGEASLAAVNPQQAMGATPGQIIAQTKKPMAQRSLEVGEAAIDTGVLVASMAGAEAGGLLFKTLGTTAKSVLRRALVSQITGRTLGTGAATGIASLGAEEAKRGMGAAGASSSLEESAQRAAYSAGLAATLEGAVGAVLQAGQAAAGSIRRGAEHLAPSMPGGKAYLATKELQTKVRMVSKKIAKEESAAIAAEGVETASSELAKAVGAAPAKGLFADAGSEAMRAWEETTTSHANALKYSTYDLVRANKGVSDTTEIGKWITKEGERRFQIGRAHV